MLVIGGTGEVGRHVVTALLVRGHRVNVLSRRGGTPDPRAVAFVGDIGTGAGLPAALDGVDTMIDVANVLTTNQEKAVRYFTESTQTVGRLGAAAGVSHLVVLSIVGCDRVAFGYYRGKVAQEDAALGGPVPATVLRATQFHEFARQNLSRFRLGPVALMPGMRCQPIAASEVAMALADVAEKPAVGGRAPDVGGPEIEWLPDMARAVSECLGPRTRIVPLRMPGAIGRAMRGDALLLDSGGVARGPSFQEWLATAAGSGVAAG
jgi:uncharacterized protein YbjT (DUF2867 family)